ncbi:MAG: hypothetical protein ACC651_13890 [Candidatus Scalindua sp.]
MNRKPGIVHALIIFLFLISLGGCGSSSSSDAGSGSTGGSSGSGTKYIFATSSIYDGNLGGLSGADSKCALVATAGALSGTFQAWISNDSTNAIDRITGNGPWYLTDGTLLFNNKAGLTLTPMSNINKDENGQFVNTGGGYVWTGTDLGGTSNTAIGNCSNWTTNLPGVNGLVGSIVANNIGWTESLSQGCSNVSTHLYCLQE